MTLDALRSFLVFADHANFTRAAEELHISQPALHVKITKLGTAVGAPLYARDGRSLVLTPAGVAVAQLATSLDRQVEDLVRELHAEPDARPLVLAAGEGAHLAVLAGGVRRLLARGGEVRLLTTDRAETIDAVRSGAADVGVTVLAGRPRGLHTTTLATYPQVLVLPSGHPLARRRTLALADLAGATLVLPPPDRPHRRAIDRALAAARVRVAVGVEAEGWAPMLHFVGLGIGLAIVNGCVAPPADLVVRPIEDLPTITYTALRRPADAPDARLGDLVDLLRSGAP